MKIMNIHLILLFNALYFKGTTACNFDNGNMCTWTNDHTMDQFNWTLGNGSTSSAGKTGPPRTGPKNDHTKGTAQGKVRMVFI